MRLFNSLLIVAATPVLVFMTAILKTIFATKEYVKDDERKVDKYLEVQDIVAISVTLSIFGVIITSIQLF